VSEMWQRTVREKRKGRTVKPALDKNSVLAARCQAILNLHIAYTNSGKFPDEFGREFFIAVGEILSGVPLEQIEVYHIPQPIGVVVERRERD